LQFVFTASTDGEKSVKIVVLAKLPRIVNI